MRYLDGVVTLKYDAAKCVGCGLCAEVCPHAVFNVPERKAVLADRDGCMECGACAKNCPTSAISVVPGVGCAAGIIMGWLTGGPATCGCGDEGGCC